MNFVLAHLVYSSVTLVMLAILLRWLAPWIGIDLKDSRLRWVCAVIDPVVQRVRRILPSLGPVDFAPLATVLGLWIARSLVVEMLLSVQPAP